MDDAVPTSPCSTRQSPVGRDELLRRAALLVPVLKARAARTEQLRQIPSETVQDLVSSGLIRIGNPRRYGGHGVEVDVVYDVGWELGRGCGSTAWCYSLWTVHNRSTRPAAARAVLESEPIQRFHRDVHGASHHAALGWDVAAELFGRQTLGLGP